MDDHPYGSLLDEVQRPARYVGGEYRSRRRTPPAKDALHVVLAFPDVYEIGMSHQGLSILQAILDSTPTMRADRLFAPWADMEAGLRARGLPLLTLDEHVPASEADVLGISLQYELTYSNVLTLLDLSGIPLRSADRDDCAPLVLGGGPLATHPEPVAPFFDLFLVGEAEDALLPLLEDIRRLRRAGVPRRTLLTELATRHPGVYVPALHPLAEDPRTGLLARQPAAEGGPSLPVRRVVAALERHPYPTDGLVPTAEAVFDRAAIEVARGCQQGCRFCQAGMIYRPVRERPPEQVARAALEATAAAGYDEVSFSSLSTADYAALPVLLPALMGVLDPCRVALSVSSLRAYGLPNGLLQQIRRVRKTGLTLAPEAGTQRLRDAINKNVTEDELIDAVRRAASLGWRRVKLYFMVGLPTETDEDVSAIATLAQRVRNAPRFGGRGRPLDVTVSVSNHVPKPHCPFQWEAALTAEELTRRHNLVRAAAQRTGLSLKFHDEATSVLEAVLARGDARLADLIEAAWRAGARFDGWDDLHRPELWVEALATTGIPTAPYLAELPEDARLPWDHLDVGVRTSFLVAERRRTYAGQPTPACGAYDAARTSDTPGRCYRCGAECDQTAVPPTAEEIATRVAAAIADAPRPPRAAGPEDELARYRLRYEKRGPARTLGHLDLTRHLLRTMRRAGLRLAYSAGFHPHPIVSYPPPLPVGTESLGCIVDVVAVADADTDEGLLRRLDAASIEGVRWSGLRRLPLDGKKVSRAVRAADHVLRLDRDAAARALAVRPEEAEAAFAARAAAWATAEGALVVGTVRKAVARTVDVRPALLPLGSEEVVAPYRERLQVRADELLVGVRLSLAGEGSGVRPVEWLAAVLPEYEGRVRTVRAALWAAGANGTLADPLAEPVEDASGDPAEPDEASAPLDEPESETREVE